MKSTLHAFRLNTLYQIFDYFQVTYLSDASSNLCTKSKHYLGKKCFFRIKSTAGRADLLRTEEGESQRRRGFSGLKADPAKETRIVLCMLHNERKKFARFVVRVLTYVFCVLY